MKSLLGPHPAVCAFLLCGGGCLAAVGLYDLFQPHAPTGSTANARIGVLGDGLAIVAGLLLWLVGTVAFGRMYGVRARLALALGFLAIPGLVIIRLVGRRLTPHEAWCLSNPTLTDAKTARRSYRDIKPLY